MTTPTTVQVRFQFRADTAANWTAINPVLLANELGRETDSGRVKIGTGSDAWADLPYQALGRISDADIATDAEIAVSKLANGTANQILTTDGTDVTWTDSPTIAGNVIISGNLTVNGTETIINVDTLQVEDKTIEMGNVTTPTDLTADGGGVVLKGASDKTLLWVDSTDSWTSSENIDLASGKTYKIAGTDVLSATALGSAVTDSSLTSVGNLTDLTVDTDTLVVDATNDRVGINTASPATPLEIARLGTAWAGAAPIVGTALFINSGTASTTSPTRVSILSGTESDAAIYFGDTDNNAEGIIQLDNTDDSLQFSVNGSERLRLTATGEFEFIGAGTAGTSEAVYFSGSAPVDSLVIDSSGRVGIGTTTFSTSFESLRVQNSGNNTHISAIASNTGLSIINLGDTDDFNIGGIIYDHSNDSLGFRTDNTVKATIDSSGNVGIGTEEPLGLLNVSSGASVTTISADADELFISNDGNAGMTIGASTNSKCTIAFAEQGVGNERGKIVYDTNDESLQFFAADPTNERARIDASGRLLVGATTSVDTQNYLGNNYGGPSIQQHGATQGPAALAVYNWGNSGASPAALVLNKSLGNAVGTRGALTGANQDIGAITFNGDDGATFLPAAAILAETDGTPSTDVMPGRIVFMTNSGDSEANPTERMRITSNGSVGVGGAPGTYQVFGITGAMNQTDGTTTEVVSARGTINSGSTSVSSFISRCAVSTGQTITNYKCFDANPGTNNGTTTNQFGFTVQSTLTQGTNNYGFFANIASAANRWNFYANGTAPNYFAGTIASLGSYNDTTASGANVFISSTGDIQRSTSSIRYKTDVENIDTGYADNVIFNARPVWYRSLCEADNAGWSYYGLIAEEIAELDPRLVFWGRPTKEVLQEEAKDAVLDDEGNVIEPATEAVYTNVEDTDAELRPEGVQYDRLTVMLIDVVQRQQKAIEALEAKVAALEAS